MSDDDELFRFEHLDVYKRSIKLSIEIIKKTVQIPTSYRRIHDQLVGSLTSIPLNIAEGFGRKSVKKIQQFIFIARGSAFETVANLCILNGLSLISDDDYASYHQELSEISRMLTGLHHSFNP